eukprot:3194756-Pyramimonas_sp.AAC.1
MQARGSKHGGPARGSCPKHKKSGQAATGGARAARGPLAPAREKGDGAGEGERWGSGAHEGRRGG